MNRPVLLLVVLLAASVSGYSQTPGDSTFSLMINGGVSFTHANDPHINKWLVKYGYPKEPHVRSSDNLELTAIPANSNWMFGVRVSSINSGKNLTSFNLMGEVFRALIKNRSFLLFAGLGTGYHSDIITLNGNLPPNYREIATTYHKQLSLRRMGLILEPAIRAFWFPVNIRNVQVGLYGSIGVDLEYNSTWRLGYYDAKHGAYSRFKKIQKPADQSRASEYGLAYNGGLSVRINLH